MVGNDTLILRRVHIYYTLILGRCADLKANNPLRNNENNTMNYIKTNNASNYIRINNPMNIRTNKACNSSEKQMR